VAKADAICQIGDSDVKDTAVPSMVCERGSECGKIGVLFSGGIDSVLLTAVLHTVLAAHLSIDLLNVTFIKSAAPSGTAEACAGPETVKRDSPSTLRHGQRTKIAVDDAPSPDRLAAIAAYLELQVSLFLPPVFHHVYNLKGLINSVFANLLRTAAAVPGAAVAAGAHRCGGK
jgi:hypothetical protein